MAKQDETAERDARIAAVLPLLSAQEKAEHADEIAQFEQRQRAKALTAGKSGKTISVEEKPMGDVIKDIENARGIDPNDPHHSDDNIAVQYVGAEEAAELGANGVRNRYFKDVQRPLTIQVRDQDQKIVDIAADEVARRLAGGKALLCTEDPKTLADATNLSPEQVKQLSLVDANNLFTNQNTSFWQHPIDSMLNNPINFLTRGRAAKTEKTAIEDTHDKALLALRDERCKAEGLATGKPNIAINIEHLDIDNSHNVVTVVAPRPRPRSHPQPHHTSNPAPQTKTPAALGDICKNVVGDCKVILGGADNSTKIIEHVENPSDSKTAPAHVVAAPSVPDGQTH